jgi:SOS-response transcriptional repressor LexA/DNA-binding Xre family transcriptional regulator
MTYIDRIKKLKSEQKITNDRLSEMTGIPLGTLSKILAGISDSPKLSNIISICEALGCSIDYIVTGKEDNPNNYLLDDGEIQLIESYRELDEHGKELVVLVLDKERERLKKESYGIGTSRAAKVLDAPAVYSGLRSLTLYDLPVSAGPGEFLDGGEFETIRVPDGPATREASFALRISGDSMLPKYRDGDVVIVKGCESVEPDELGIFILDNSSYFKKYGGDRLISLNPAYADIPLAQFTSVSCIGKVLGKVKRK